MKTRILLCVLTFIGSLSLYGQVQITSEQYQAYQKIPQEQILVHANSDFILTGETIFYTVYCLMEQTNSLSELSKYAYVELVNSDKKSILKQKVKLTKGLGQGDIFITNSMPTGVYKLISYTEWMKNENLFFQKNIRIVNPFTKSNIVPSPKVEMAKKIIKSDENSISLDKSSYSKREKVTLDFTQLSRQLQGGKFSLSVKIKSPIESEIELNQPLRKSLGNNKVFLPEFRGELIQGKIIPKNSNSILENVQVGLSIIQENGISKISRVNADGQFYFVIDEDYNGGTAIIEVLSRGDYTIEVIKSQPLDFSNLSFPKLSLNSVDISNIKERAVYMQVENAFADVKQDSIQKIETRTPIFRKDALTYQLDDYKRFKTMRETFIEVVELTSIERENGAYYFKAKKRDFATSDPKALVIVDGYIASNHEEIVEMNPRLIKQISVLKKSYKLGSKVYQGVIYIDTYNRDFVPKEKSNMISITLMEPTPIKEYYTPNYEQKNSKRTPDYRTQLTWQPRFNSSLDQHSFYTSDVSGTFEITLQGITKDGEMISIKQLLEVK